MHARYLWNGWAHARHFTIFGYSGAAARYCSARRRLVDKLGIEPGPQLRGVQACFLSG
jgi:hypothetical protein